MTRYSKLIAFVVGAVAQAIAQGLISGTAAVWIGVVIAALTGAGIYTVPNTDPAE